MTGNGHVGSSPTPGTGLPLNRHLERYMLEETMSVIRSTAADFLENVYPNVGGPGGSTQYLLPENFLSGAMWLLVVLFAATVAHAQGDALLFATRGEPGEV